MTRAFPADPIVVAPTPMPAGESDALDHDRLAAIVERQLATPLSGFVVGSGGGEELYLSEADRVAAVRIVAEVSAGAKLVIGGIDSPSPTETVRLAELMAEAGADLVRIRIPQTELGGSTGTAVRYFEAVTARAPVPVVVIHQTFQTGGVAASPEELGAICSLENVCAYIFWHNLRYESYVTRFLPDGIRLWTPNGSLLLPGAVIGATGACCFFANWGSGLVVDILELALAGRLTEAQALQRRILHADFHGMTHGVASLKAGLELLGYDVGPPRSPAQPLAAAELDELRVAFAEAGLV